MTDQITSEAIEAAALAEFFNDLTLGGQMPCEGNEWDRADERLRRSYIASAERQLAAAYPHLRQQIAQEITERRGNVDPDERDLYKRGIAYGLSVAANLARGAAQQGGTQ